MKLKRVSSCEWNGGKLLRYARQSLCSARNILGCIKYYLLERCENMKYGEELVVDWANKYQLE